jgi:hypothetical protein
LGIARENDNFLLIYKIENKSMDHHVGISLKDIELGQQLIVDQRRFNLEAFTVNNIIFSISIKSLKEKMTNYISSFLYLSVFF